MRDILKQTAIESTRDVKHVLATLLRSLSRFLRVLNYHGNINPQTITAVARSAGDQDQVDQKVREGLIEAPNHRL